MLERTSLVVRYWHFLPAVVVDFCSLCHFLQTITRVDFLLLISLQFVLVSVSIALSLIIIVFFKGQLLVFCPAVLSSCALFYLLSL